MSYFGYPLYPVTPTTQLSEVNISGTTTLGVGAATYTKAFLITGAGGYTITLPALDATNYTAATFSIANTSSATCTINVNGVSGDTLQFLGGSYTSIAILPGERMVFQNMQTIWMVGLESASRTTTAPQFDSTIRTASTAFVQRALGNAQGAVGITANTTLTTGQIGSFIEITGGASLTITLPATSATVTGGTFYFYNNTSSSATIATNGVQVINNGPTNATTYTLSAGGSVILITDGVSWSVVSSTGVVSRTAPGYQKLQSGIILQWGASTFSTGGSAVTYPITFPNGLGTLVLGNPDSSSVVVSTTASTASGFTGVISAGGSASIFWAAIGW
jgi:hypothetical protein